jgi:hypothetical protein
MAMGFDELVEQLLYDVALSGSQGMTFNPLSRHISYECSNHDLKFNQQLSYDFLN